MTRAIIIDFATAQADLIRKRQAQAEIILWSPVAWWEWWFRVWWGEAR